jgi:hypothetical protein
MPGRTDPSLIATLAASLPGPSPIAGTLSVINRPVSGTAVSGAAADDWPADDGPPDDGPGRVVSWTGGVTIDQVLSAVQRYQRHRAGLDLPAWAGPYPA